jgi:hypothetical protein
MKASWQTISTGLDQLWFTPLGDCESIQDRADATENFLKLNGWTWDEVLDTIAKEPLDGQSSIRN